MERLELEDFINRCRELTGNPGWFGNDDIIKCAGEYKISGAIIGNGKHWVVYQEVLGKEIVVCDPLKGYDIVKPDKDWCAIVTGNLAQKFGHYLAEYQSKAGIKLETIVRTDNSYYMQFGTGIVDEVIMRFFKRNPRKNKCEKIQRNGRDCGPLCLYILKYL